MKKIEKIRLDRISSTYRSGVKKLTALEEVSLYARPGEFVAVLGPSGSGKSTILKIAAGLLKPDHGKIWIDGKDVTGIPQLVGYMPQQDLLLPWKTMWENAALPLLAKGVRKKDAFDRVTELIPLFGIEGFADYYPYQLSGGMRQRAALLRTFLIESNLMLLDEPFAALDALTREKMQAWLLNIWETFKRSVLFVTHSIDEAIYLSDRVYVITERPGKNALEQSIEIERPRDINILTTRDFTLYKRILIKALAG